MVSARAAISRSLKRAAGTCITDSGDAMAVRIVWPTSRSCTRPVIGSTMRSTAGKVSRTKTGKPALIESYMAGLFYKGRLLRLLEPCEARVSRTVLRGGGGREAAPLPDR